MHSTGSRQCNTICQHEQRFFRWDISDKTVRPSCYSIQFQCSSGNGLNRKKRQELKNQQCYCSLFICSWRGLPAISQCWTSFGGQLVPYALWQNLKHHIGFKTLAELAQRWKIFLRAGPQFTRGTHWEWVIPCEGRTPLQTPRNFWFPLPLSKCSRIRVKRKEEV